MRATTFPYSTITFKDLMDGNNMNNLLKLFIQPNYWSIINLRGVARGAVGLIIDLPHHFGGKCL